MRLARQLFTEESMEAMIKYYEGETLGLGGKTAGSPGMGLQDHAPASTLALTTVPRPDMSSPPCLSHSKTQCAGQACVLICAFCARRAQGMRLSCRPTPPKCSTPYSHKLILRDCKKQCLSLNLEASESGCAGPLMHLGVQGRALCCQYSYKVSQRGAAAVAAERHTAL